MKKFQLISRIIFILSPLRLLAEPGFTDLPQELLIQVFEFIPPTSYSETATTCKEFANTARDKNLMTQKKKELRELKIELEAEKESLTLLRPDHPSLFIRRLYDILINEYSEFSNTSDLESLNQKWSGNDNTEGLYRVNDPNKKVAPFIMRTWPLSLMSAMLGNIYCHQLGSRLPSKIQLMALARAMIKDGKYWNNYIPFFSSHNYWSHNQLINDPDWVVALNGASGDVKSSWHIEKGRQSVLCVISIPESFHRN